jgi:hypothetical protein
LIADEMTKYSGMNCSIHYQNSISSSFFPELYFDLLLSFPNIWTVTHFKTTCLILIIVARVSTNIV